jgi:hypothetical protein
VSALKDAVIAGELTHFLGSIVRHGVLEDLVESAQS